MVKGAVEIVEYRQQLPEEVRQGIFVEIGFLTLRSFAKILEIRERPQIAVLHLRGFSRRAEVRRCSFRTSRSGGICRLLRSDFHLMFDVRDRLARVLEDVAVVFAAV